MMSKPMVVVVVVVVVVAKLEYGPKFTHIQVWPRFSLYPYFCDQIQAVNPYPDYS